LLEHVSLAEVVVKSMQSGPCSHSNSDEGPAEPTSRPYWMPLTPRDDMPGADIWDSLLQPPPGALLEEAAPRSEQKAAPPPPVSTLRDVAAESAGQEPPAPPEAGAVVGRQMPDPDVWEQLLEGAPAGEPRRPYISGSEQKGTPPPVSTLRDVAAESAGQEPPAPAVGRQMPDLDLWEELLEAVPAIEPRRPYISGSDQKATPPSVSTLHDATAGSAGQEPLTPPAVGRQMPDLDLWEELLKAAQVGEPRQPHISGSEQKAAPPPPVSMLHDAAAERARQAPPAPPESGAETCRQMPDLALWDELLEAVPVGKPRQPYVSRQLGKAEECAESGLLESPVKAAGPQRGQEPSPTAAGLTAPGMDLWDALLKPVDVRQVPWHLPAPTEDPLALPK